MDNGIRGRTVFLTGATGEIGGELLRRLLGAGCARIYCLIRNAGTAAPLDRLRERAGQWGSSPEFADRLRPVVGDIALPGMGIAPADRDALRAETQIIFHCAATTSFLKKKECWETNVRGLRHLMELARACAHRPRFFYFGSSAAAGDRRDACIHENEYPTPGATHFVEYSASKAAAETILAEEGADLDIVVLRPSLVLPDVEVPQEILRECIWPLQIMKECRALPLNADARVDMVPLSFVGEFSLRIAASDIKHRCYHMSAGPEGATRWGDIMTVVAETFELGREISCVRGKAWEAIRPTLSRREIKYMRSVSSYFPFINQNVAFDNRRLVEAVGKPSAEALDFRRYLPGLLRKVSLEEAIEQSFYD